MWYQDNKISCLSLWLLVVKCRSLDSLLSSVFWFFVLFWFFFFICICVKEVWNVTTAKWEEFYFHFLLFTKPKKGGRQWSPIPTIYYSSPKQEVPHKEASFSAFFLPPWDRWSILLPNVILWGWSFCFLSDSWPVTRCKSDVSLDPALTLYWRSKKCPTPQLFLWLVMLWYCCFLGYLLLGDPASCSCCFQPSLPIRTVFSVAIFGLSEKNHIYEENN